MLISAIQEDKEQIQKLLRDFGKAEKASERYRGRAEKFRRYLRKPYKIRASVVLVLVLLGLGNESLPNGSTVTKFKKDA